MSSSSPIFRPLPPRHHAAASPRSIKSRRTSSSQVVTSTLPPTSDPDSPLTRQLALASETVELLATRLAGVHERNSSRTARASSSCSELELSETQRREEDGRDRDAVRCCCEIASRRSGEILAQGACPSRDNQIAVEEDLELSATIGQALLQRYEALASKRDAVSRQCDDQSELLAQSYSQCANLERANDTHIKRYGELSRRNEGLERRIAQMHHTQTLTSTALLNLRSELTNLRRSHTAAIASDDDQVASLTAAHERESELKERNADLLVRLGLVEAALGEAERLKMEEKTRREMAESEARRWRALVETKVQREEVSEDMVETAKTRLSDLLGKIQDPSQADAPDVQRTLETLVADNVLAHHNSAELASMVAETKEQVKILKEENDDLRRSLGVAPRPPLPGELDNAEDTDEQGLRDASVLARSGSGSASGGMRRPLSMQPGSSSSHGRKYSWTPSVAASIASSGRNSVMLSKRDSMAPSFGSSIGDVLSPRTSMMQPIAQAVLMKDQSSGDEMSGRDSQATSPVLARAVSMASPRNRTSAGMGYTINGLPKMPTTRAGNVKQGMRSYSADRPGVQRTFTSGVDSIAEWSAAENDGFTLTRTPDLDGPASPMSPADTNRGDAMRRKRLSLNPSVSYFSPRSPQLQRLQTDPVPTSPVRCEGGVQSPRSDHETGLESPAAEQRRTARRQLLLLTCSKGVQTETEPDSSEATPSRLRRMISGCADPGLGALGFENASSTTTTPQLLSAFSPKPDMTPTDRSETSSLHDPRSTALPQLIDHMSKLLGRIRQSDVPTLTRRLKRQHLPGDVGHLSQSTMKTLTTEVSDLRTYFKSILDQEVAKRVDAGKRQDVPYLESSITRRDFMLLLRLFKELFGALVELQATVNRVIIDPASAVKLKEAAQAAGDDEDATRGRSKANKQASTGLGWIAAPLAKYFVTAAVDDGTDVSDSSKGVSDRNRLQPPVVKTAPKQLASTSATTTHVNVEFGGTGMVKRATSSMPMGDDVDPLPPSPADTLTNVASHGNQTSARRLRPAITLGDGSVRGAPARRDDLRGIFAGAPGTSLGAGWRAVSNPAPVGHPRLRSTSSQHFGQQRHGARGNGHKRQLSTAVDAVIDQPLPEHRLDDDLPKPLLERTLRPRGLSDSSIRSTFVSHEVMQPTTAAGPQQVGGSLRRSDTQTRSMMSQIGRRFQALTGVLAAPAAPVPDSPSSSRPEIPIVVETNEESQDKPSTLHTEAEEALPTPTRTSTPAKTITGSPSHAASGSILPTGFLGVFAAGTYVDPSGLSRSIVQEFPDGDNTPCSSFGMSRGLLGQSPRGGSIV